MTEPKAGNDEIQTDRQDQKLGGTQLSISHLLAITVGASVVCALLAAVLRRLPKEQQTKGTLFILLMIFVCLVVLAIFYVLRSRAEKQAGPSHFITKAALTSWFHVFGILSCVATLAAMAIGLWIVAGNQSVFSIWEFAYLVPLLGMFTGNYLMNAFLWKTNPKSVDLRQNGIIVGTFNFAPWSYFHGFRWNQFTQNLMLLTDGGFAELKVPENQRSQLEVALEKFIPKKAGLS